MAWLSIRSQGGRLLLRIEDLDHPKVKPAAAAQAVEDLRWLGLDWDEGPGRGGPCAPYRQSERRAWYREALDLLRGRNLVYPCTCSRRDAAAAQGAPHPEEHETRYTGRCRDRWPSYAAAAAHLAGKRLPVWRFRAPDRPVCFVDRFRGRQEANVQRSAGDFALARDPDGAGYMLAVVVDDAAMGVTEVLRGDDLLPSTHRQLLLYEALGLAPPSFAHVPLVVGADGRRLAKRHGDTRLSALRADGFSPEQIVGLLAHWCGWAEPDESLTAAALLDRFDLKTLRPEPAILTAESRRAARRPAAPP